ncbi:electron transfer flavoprotein subunit beta/FixA family protein [Breznakiella homolactica]|uniref:Electron transfer flavoprotein subunit beta/FixA family protein n=1 Tax=Breznakiella homolactica TaxID=2798577 RepID=A0A7T7XQY8_9SPIR|nr:electron transfer flavoprotein subunit beta/FixA family protein [Breznakiella homolactica]QQO10871.1 electron transfer flavoprotein subunit beta/FixA family protein [Breznakiella homolactica]
MKILIPIKQVPESSNVKMDPETGTVIRSGLESVVNPLDLYALETAIRLKESCGAELTAISMGPPQAMKVLKEAVAMGCDHGVLISDRKFGGADTWATSYTLSQAIRKLGDFDLIIAGERATDGDTAQVGPAIAAWLDVPVATYVSKISEVKDSRIYLERLVEEGYQMLSMPFPCLITVVKEIAVPRLPTLKGKIRSRDMEIPVFTSENMDLNPDFLGLKGSPTKVVRINTPKVTRSGKIVQAGDDESLNAAADEFVVFLEEKGIL